MNDPRSATRDEIQFLLPEASTGSPRERQAAWADAYPDTKHQCRCDSHGWPLELIVEYYSLAGRDRARMLVCGVTLPHLL